MELFEISHDRKDQNLKYFGYNPTSDPGIDFWNNFEIQRFWHFSLWKLP